MDSPGVDSFGSWSSDRSFGSDSPFVSFCLLSPSSSVSLSSFTRSPVRPAIRSCSSASFAGSAPPRVRPSALFCNRMRRSTSLIQSRTCFSALFKRSVRSSLNNNSSSDFMSARPRSCSSMARFNFAGGTSSATVSASCFLVRRSADCWAARFSRAARGGFVSASISAILRISCSSFS